ncbi:MAG: PqqD family protein [Lachnospiraceae bacterium]|nr:PqqD family protein [Lachnospiraceae bacterium]
MPRRKKIKLKKDMNYLDLIPVCACEWKKNKNGIVTVDMVHHGFYHWIAHKFFKTPDVSHIALDRFGSFVWQQIDGNRTIYEIGENVKEQFGKATEPLYERLAKYFSTLYDNHFIEYKEV